MKKDDNKIKLSAGGELSGAGGEQARPSLSLLLEDNDRKFDPGAKGFLLSKFMNLK